MTISAHLAAVIALLAFEASGAEAQTPLLCPIESVVAKILTIDPQDHMVILTRGDERPRPVGVGVCILYGDRLEASPGDVAKLWTAKGERHVGGAYDPVYAAPKSETAPASESIISFFARLFGSFDVAKYTPAVSRAGSRSCETPSAGAPAIAALERLPAGDQRLGADVTKLAIAWAPSPDPLPVRIELRGDKGDLVAHAETCRSSHVTLSLPAALHPDDRLRLDVSDGRGGDLQYAIHIVAPEALPQPPVNGASDWLNGAWRLAEGGPEFALDGLSRLQGAPTDALAAHELSALFFDNQPLKFAPPN